MKMGETRLTRRFGPRTLIALMLLFLLHAACFLVPFYHPDCNDIDLIVGKTGPSLAHPLGTDRLGRDMLGRVLHGGRVSLGLSLRATVLAAIMGGSLGILAGVTGGRTDALLMRTAEGVEALPPVLLAIIAETILGQGNGAFSYGLAVAEIPAFLTVTRAMTAEIMSMEFVEAALALGATRRQILRKHVLRHLAPPLSVTLFESGAAVLLNTTVLGYLGLGIQPPWVEWGGLVFQSYEYIRSDPVLAFAPNLAVTATVLLLRLGGAGVREALLTPDRGEI